MDVGEHESTRRLREALDVIVGENPASVADGRWRTHPLGGGMYRVVGVVHDMMQVEYFPFTSTNVPAVTAAAELPDYGCSYACDKSLAACSCGAQQANQTLARLRKALGVPPTQQVSAAGGGTW